MKKQTAQLSGHGDDVGVKRRFPISISFAIVMLLLLFLLYLAVFDFLQWNNYREYLLTSAKDCSEIVKENVDDYFVILEQNAAIIEQYNMLNDGKANTLIKVMAERYDVDSISLLRTNGTVYFSNGQVARPENIQDRINSSDSRKIVRNRIDMGDSFDGLTFSVPIQKNGSAIGALNAHLRQEQVNKLLGVRQLGGSEWIGIITADGDKITTEGYLQDDVNFFTSLTDGQLGGKVEYTALRQRIRIGEQGSFKIDGTIGDFWVGYAPVGLEGWVMLTSISNEAASRVSQPANFTAAGLALAVMVTMAILMLYLLRVQHKGLNRLQVRNGELNVLIQSIPGGVISYRADETEQIRLVSDGMLRLFDYTENEFRTKFNNRFSNLIHPADRRAACETMSLQRTSDITIRCRFRIKAKGGRTRWVYACGQIVYDEANKPWNYMVLVDITEQKEAEEKTRLNEERYRLIMEKTDSIIYEWDIQNDTISFSDVWEKKFGYVPPRFNFYAGIERGWAIHPDDASSFRQQLDDAREGKPYSENVLRIRSGSEGEYIWCRMSLMVILDTQGVPCRAIGIVIDVDREKREAAVFQVKAERDSLTHLYNRGATEQLIRKYLENAGTRQSGAMLILDVDDFKRINDSFGHLCGDQILRSVAAVLQSIFRANDVVGRIGGDEYLIFMKDVSVLEPVLAKAAAVGAALRQIRVECDRSYSMSCSIGIALYPAHANNYETLFQRADAALYETKRKGKDNYCVYTEELPVYHKAAPKKIDSDEREIVENS